MVQTWDFAQKRCWVPPYHHPPTWFLGKDLMSTHQPGISKGNDKHRSFFEIFEPANRDLFFLGPGFWGKMSKFVSDFATIMQLRRKQTPGLWLWKMSIWSLIQSCTSPQLSPCWEPSFRRFATVCRTLVSSHPPSNLSSRSNRSINPPEARCGWEEYSKLSLPSMPDTLLEGNDAPKKWSCLRPILVIKPLARKTVLASKEPKMKPATNTYTEVYRVMHLYKS